MAERKSFLLRIPEPLWQQLKRLADQELRSVNGEIEFLLRDALKRRGIPPGEPSDDDRDE